MSVDQNSVLLSEALQQRRSVRNFTDRPIPHSALTRLLWAAQGITGEAENRTTPSAHALHPLTLRVLAGVVDGLSPAIYAVHDDAKTLSALQQGDLRTQLQHAAIDAQPWIGDAAAIITICGDFEGPVEAFADQPPYGQRGERYVYIEAGAAAQNLQLQACAEGLGCVLVAGFIDEATARILHLEEPLVPILHLCVGFPDGNSA